MDRLNNAKNKILLVPHYTASFRYLEKLIPYLQTKYEIFFLFTPKVKEKFLQEMEIICKQKGYGYFVIARPKLPRAVKKIPLLYQPLLLSLYYRWKIQKLLKKNIFQKIIANNDTNFFNNYLFQKANQMGAQTMVLQWSIFGRQRKEEAYQKSWDPKITGPWWKKIGKLIKRKMVNSLMERGNISQRGRRNLGAGQAQKIGVFNQKTFAILKKAGIKEEKMAIVGSMDFVQAEKIQEELFKDSLLREKTAQKYGLDLAKKNIIIFSSPFNTKDICLLSDQEQLTYFQKIAHCVREVFNPKGADILLKIHPAENLTTYQSLKALGVKLFDKFANNEELIALSSLYIATCTTTNYIAIAMNKEAIFINLLELERIECVKPSFGIKKFVHNEEELKKLLRDFKNNCLERQYEIPPEDIYTKNSLQKIINWIG